MKKYVLTNWKRILLHLKAKPISDESLPPHTVTRTGIAVSSDVGYTAVTRDLKRLGVAEGKGYIEMKGSQHVEGLKNPRDVFSLTHSGLRRANGVIDAVKVKYSDKGDPTAKPLSVDRIIEILPSAKRLSPLDVFLMASPKGYLDASCVSGYVSQLRIRKDILDCLLSVKGETKSMQSNVMRKRMKILPEDLLEQLEQMKSMRLLDFSELPPMKHVQLVELVKPEFARLVVQDWESKLDTLTEVRKGMTPTVDASSAIARDDVPILLLKARAFISEQIGVPIERLKVVSLTRDEPIEATIGDRDTDRLYLLQVYISGRVGGFRQIQ